MFVWAWGVAKCTDRVASSLLLYHGVAADQRTRVRICPLDLIASPMKITINSITPVYSWHWSVPDDELCGICRISFDGTCPNCLYPGDSCPLTIGTCHHAFHLHCIEKWLQQSSSRGLCPMCRQAFTTDESLEVNKGIVLPNSIVVDSNNTPTVGNGNGNGNIIVNEEEAQLLS